MYVSRIKALVVTIFKGQIFTKPRPSKLKAHFKKFFKIEMYGGFIIIVIYELYE